MISVDFACLDLAPNSRILDIGCGSGRHTAAAYAMADVAVVGADADYSDLQQAKSRLNFHDRVGAHANGCWALAAADITHLPFDDQSFDLVICAEVLEHIPDHIAAVRESSRVLKPGCHLVVSVPRRWPETLCWALSRQYRNTQGGHLRIYATQGLITLIRAHGLIHWRTHYAHSLHTPYWWLKCLVGPDRNRLWPVERFHQFLTWDMMQKPRLTRCLDRWLNPLMGKSVVLYFRKSV